MFVCERKTQAYIYIYIYSRIDGYVQRGYEKQKNRSELFYENVCYKSVQCRHEFHINLLKIFNLLYFFIPSLFCLSIIHGDDEAVDIISSLSLLLVDIDLIMIHLV